MSGVAPVFCLLMPTAEISSSYSTQDQRLAPIIEPKCLAMSAACQSLKQRQWRVVKHVQCCITVRIADRRSRNRLTRQFLTCCLTAPWFRVWASSRRIKSTLSAAETQTIPSGSHNSITVDTAARKEKRIRKFLGKVPSKHSTHFKRCLSRALTIRLWWAFRMLWTRNPPWMASRWWILRASSMTKMGAPRTVWPIRMCYLNPSSYRIATGLKSQIGLEPNASRHHNSFKDRSFIRLSSSSNNNRSNNSMPPEGRNIEG